MQSTRNVCELSSGWLLFMLTSKLKSNSIRPVGSFGHFLPCILVSQSVSQSRLFLPAHPKTDLAAEWVYTFFSRGYYPLLVSKYSNYTLSIYSISFSLFTPLFPLPKPSLRLHHHRSLLSLSLSRKLHRLCRAGHPLRHSQSSHCLLALACFCRRLCCRIKSIPLAELVVCKLAASL